MSEDLHLDKLRAPLPGWYRDAGCAGTDTESFFPEKGRSADEAKAVCWRCPVRRECLDFAITTTDPTNDHGVWGGFTWMERERIRRGVQPVECGLPGCWREYVPTPEDVRRFCSARCGRTHHRILQQEKRHAKARQEEDAA